MVIDTSVLIAILFKEPDSGGYARVLLDHACVIGAPNYLEACVVADRQRNAELGESLDPLLAQLSVSIVAFGEEDARLARKAYAVFGKGRHKAALNFGDCCAYALAKARSEPLLFKGGDFALTDIAAAV